MDELRTLVARGLASGNYQPSESKRIRAVPDTRTIRYYTTLGLIDGPAEMRGRTALYSRRHVLQLVAIKRLQAEGRTLSVIQQRLTGLPDRDLSSIAKLDSKFWTDVEGFLQSNATRDSRSTPITNQPDPPTDSLPFWQEPACVPNPEPNESVHATLALRVPLDDRIELLINLPEPVASDDIRELTPQQRQRLSAALQPFREELKRQGRWHD